MPTSVAEVEAALQAMRPKLRPHPIIHEFLGIVSRTSPIGLAGRVLQPLAVAAAIDLLPGWARTELELPDHPIARAAARPVLRGLAAAAALTPGEIPRQAHERVRRPTAPGPA